VSSVLYGGKVLGLWDKVPWNLLRAGVGGFFLVQYKVYVTKVRLRDFWEQDLDRYLLIATI
jgi:hypothetical protein